MFESLSAFPPLPPPLPPPSKAKQITRVIIYVAFLIIGVMGINFGIRAYRDALVPFSPRAPSFIFANNNPDQQFPTLHAGQDFAIRTYTNRLEVCVVDSAYSIMRYSTMADGTLLREVVYTWPLTRNRSLKGNAVTDKHLILPEWLQDGDYVITRQSEYVCDKERISSDGPPLKIHIENLESAD